MEEKLTYISPDDATHIVWAVCNCGGRSSDVVALSVWVHKYDKHDQIIC